MDERTKDHGCDDGLPELRLGASLHLSSSILRIAREFSLAAILSPLVYFVANLPLLVECWNLWVWVSYIWLQKTVCFLMFGRCVTWEVSGRRQAKLAQGVFCLVAIILHSALLPFRERSCRATTALHVALMLSALCLPMAVRAYDVLRQGKSLRPTLWQCLGIGCGILPYAMGTACFYILHFLNNAGRAIYIVVGLWLLLPLLAYWAGAKVWQRAADQRSMSSVVIWVIYLEVALACFGLQVFSRSGSVLIAYSSSQVLSLGYVVAEGSFCGASRSHRKRLSLEALAAYIAQGAAQLSLLLVICLHLLVDQWDLLRSLRADSASVAAQVIGSYKLFKDAPISAGSAQAVVASFAVVSVIFAGFFLLLPLLWKDVRVPQHRRSCCGCLRGRRLAVAPMEHEEFDGIGPGTVTECDNDPSTGPSSGVEAARPRWLGETSLRATYAQQCDFMADYLREHRAYTSWAIAFSLQLTRLLAVLAIRSQEMRAGVQMCYPVPVDFG